MCKRYYILFLISPFLFFACRKKLELGKYPYASSKEPLNVKLSTDALRPAISAPGSTVVLSGDGFDKYKKEELLVRFNGEPAEVINATAIRLEVKVPPRASSGMITLTINKQVLPGPLHQISGPIAADALFKSFPGASGGAILAIRFQDDGKYFITGNFSDYDNSGEADGMNGMARLNSDGSLDRSFKTRVGFRGASVSDAIQLPDGRYIVAGSFSNYRARFATGAVQNIITLNSDGSPDTMLVKSPLREKPDTLPLLNIGFDGGVDKIHQQTDGKIILTGSFRRAYRKTYGGISGDGLRDSVRIDTLYMNYLARLNPDLTLDTTYNYDRFVQGGRPTVNGAIKDSYLDAADRLMIAGAFTTYNGKAAVRIARVDTLGVLDPDFSVGNGPDNEVESIDRLPDGRIIASGKFLNVSGNVRKKLVLLSASGSVDAGFDAGESAVGTVLKARVLDNSKILISGFFDIFQGYKRDGIAILDLNGKLSATHNNFGGFKNGFAIASAAVKARSAIVLAGAFTSFDLKAVSGIVKLNY